MLHFFSIHNPGLERMIINTIPKENIPKMPSLRRMDVMFANDGYEEFQEINPHVMLGEGLAPKHGSQYETYWKSNEIK